ncbi:MAG: thiamine-phosphate kinase [Asgard group archaeon]|nr:thiamine-phosphate kinase [Asgard group archaeon]
MDKTIKELGERALLDLFEELVDNGDLPFNDDAVAYPLNNSDSMVVNIDTFVAKTDAPPNMTFYQMGAKATTMAISDLAAKGVQPEFLVASGNFPSNMSSQDTIQLVKGIRDTAHKYNTKFLGGDTNAADDISISVTVFGRIKKSNLIKRSTASKNDIICTTGSFGLTAAGFKVFIEEFESTKIQQEIFYKAVYEPDAKLKQGLILAQYGKITSCIDSSDGLAWCLKEIIRSKNNVGIEITNLPIASESKKFAESHNISGSDLVFYGGEEFELVFTIKEDDIAGLKKLMDFHIIGKITSQYPEKIVLLENDKKTIIQPKGWEHFK